MRAALAALLGLAALAAPAAAHAQDGRVIGRTLDDRAVILYAPGVVRPYAILERRRSVFVERRVPVGDVLPLSVDAYQMPRSDNGYVVLDGGRYVIDNQRRVVDILD